MVRKNFFQDVSTVSYYAAMWENLPNENQIELSSIFFISTRFFFSVIVSSCCETWTWQQINHEDWKRYKIKNIYTSLLWHCRSFPSEDPTAMTMSCLLWLSNSVSTIDEARMNVATEVL